MTALFLASTPLHTFWSLGLAHGPFASHRCVLALIDQRDGDQDFIAAALEHHGQKPMAEVVRFSQIGKRPMEKLRRARATLSEVRDFAARLRPEYIAVGNDRRAEFYAALAGSPGATGAYLDDGLFSYLPMRTSQTPAPLQSLARVSRKLIYGVATEQPNCVGGSSAAREAWVMLPDQVHAGLRGKRLHPIDPLWFRSAAVREICRRATHLAGLDPAPVQEVSLLLVLPHESFLRAQPEILARLQTAVRAAQDHGRVAFKRHPRSATLAFDLPAGCLEIPRRLPIEIIAPLLRGTTVIGALTTALISLQRLGEGVEARFIDTPGGGPHPAQQVYRAAGIHPLSRNGEPAAN